MSDHRKNEDVFQSAVFSVLWRVSLPETVSLFQSYGAQKCKPPWPPEPSIQGHPLCGLHAPASIVGATRECQAGAHLPTKLVEQHHGSVLGQGELSHQVWQSRATRESRTKASSTSKIKVECKDGKCPPAPLLAEKESTKMAPISASFPRESSNRPLALWQTI